MNELNEMELSVIQGGEITASGIGKSIVGGAFSGAVGGALTATTVSALAVPAACGAVIALTGYLVWEAFSEGAQAAKAVGQAYLN